MSLIMCFIIAVMSLDVRAVNVRFDGARQLAKERQTQSDTDADAVGKNPIRKVVQMLERLAQKISAEGENEGKLYTTFTCYCKNGKAELQQSINDNNAKVPAVQSDIESAQSQLLKFKEDLKQHQIDRDAAKKAMETATALREKEHTKYVEQFTELQGYVDTLAKAIPAVTSGMAGTRLLQTSAAVAALRRAVTNDAQLTEDDRETVVAFISGTASEGIEYIPTSGEVLGILKTMHDDFEKDVAAVNATEEEAQKLYDDLIAAKTKEVKALGASIEKKLERVGELGVEIAHMKQDLTEAEASLIEDQKFLKDLNENCESKETEWEERKKVRAEELAAIHETIKILNDDDALDLFKKTLSSSSSFLQMDSTEKLRNSALAILRKLRAVQDLATSERPEIRFLEMALKGGKVDFSKVIKMIDGMVALLAQEQSDDDVKREYCGKQIDIVEDKAKDLEKGIEDLEVVIEDHTETVATAVEEIKTLKAEIEELDKLVQEATEQRKKENEAFTQLMAENTEATELLKYAQNRLHKFYNPTLYKEPETTETDTEPPAASLLQTDREAARRHVATDPGAAPATWGEYKKKGDETTSVVSMLDLLIRHLAKEMTVAQTDEEHAQKEYEGFMQDSAGKRAKAVKAIAIKESAKADSESVKTAHEGDMKVVADKLEATKLYEQQLHVECDWLLQNYDLRKTARADEADVFKQAKAVLKGADFSLEQSLRVGRSHPRL